ncbi:hypothetical protein [Actinomadura sp. SCN-SB]|uniref:hypothetical protein n=1 Tax=Actinomadura sp. SCN-SB TaxID=3373092 RepID=UPI0037507B8F
MRARIGFLAAWAATTAAGMAISWAGVGDAMRGTALATPDLAAAVPVRQGRPPVSGPADPSAGPSPSASPSPSRSATGDTPGARPTPRRTATPAPSRETGGRVRTYVVTSGRVVLELFAGSARLVSATPDSGFQAKVWRQDGWLRVDLTDGVHGSAVFATWNGHPPTVQVYEY